MRYFVVVVAFFMSLLTSVPARADTASADIGGMRLTVTQPWYLFTHGAGGEGPERLFFALMDGGAIQGEGDVSEYALAKDDVLPAPEQLKAMKPEELQALVKRLDEKYTQLDTVKDMPAVAEVNGFTAVTLKGQTPPSGEVKEVSHYFSYYFPFKDKLIVLDAHVFGSDKDAELLGRVCGTFIPDTASGRDMNSISGGGLSLGFPASWTLLLNGRLEKEQLWAEVSKTAGEEGEIQVAKVAVLSPVAADKLPDEKDLEKRLAGEPGEPLTFFGLGTREKLEGAKVTRRESVTINGRPAALTVVTGKLEGKDSVLELRDMLVGKTLITLVTGYPLPLPDDAAKELEAMYASFVPDGK